MTDKPYNIHWLREGEEIPAELKRGKVCTTAIDISVEYTERDGRRAVDIHIEGTLVASVYNTQSFDAIMMLINQVIGALHRKLKVDVATVKRSIEQQEN